jgi:hypothetical protein
MVASRLQQTGVAARRTRDAVCLGLTFHPAGPELLATQPWRVWLQSFSFLRLKCDDQEGSLRCAIQDFDWEAARGPREERALLQSLANAARKWEDALIVTLGGSRVAIPALRWRCLASCMVVPNLFPPLASVRVPQRVTCVDLIEDLAFPSLSAPPSLSGVCDAIGLPFTQVFEDWRHDPAVVAAILSASAAVCLAVRMMHDGTTGAADVLALVEGLKRKAAGFAGKVPWLERLVADFDLAR